MNFPKDFTWGAATASYQVEGAASEDGKGPSIWDRFCRRQGNIKNGDTGDLACDHYHRYTEDVTLMNEIGLNAYRFSISWPRVIPQGKGAVNRKGLDFYSRLVDALLEKGIDPWITLFHWDYPQALFLEGGWLNRDSSSWFADYTETIIKHLSDRVTRWITINEPQVFLQAGYQLGQHAPGLQVLLPDLLLAAHNVLLSHGKSVQAIRSQAHLKPVIGAAPVGIVYLPEDHSPEAIKAARKATFSIKRKDVWNNTWFADPMILGAYPEDGLQLFGSEMPGFSQSDMEIIHQPLDFYGVNIYFGERMLPWKISSPVLNSNEGGHPRTAMGWEVTPEAIYWGLKFFYDRYRLPVVVTENGMANCDWVHLDGRVHDPQRIDFLTRYLMKIQKSIAEGIPVQGYFVWSLLDNFEWTLGYSRRFGLVYVNYQTQKRILKDSAYWYQKLIAAHGDNL